MIYLLKMIYLFIYLGFDTDASNSGRIATLFQQLQGANICVILQKKQNVS